MASLAPRLLLAPLPRLLAPRSLSSSTWENITTERRGTGDRVGLVALNRPKALNALSGALMEELTTALEEWDEV